MARRRRARGLGNATVCRLGSERTDLGQCATKGKLTLCVGDRVTRADIKVGNGTVIALSVGRNNAGKKQPAANVCFDDSEPRAVAYPYVFSELKKLRR